jgi:hypothetical protein
MILRTALLSALLVAGLPGPAADARPPRDREQDAAHRGLQEGRHMPLRVLEAALVPRMQMRGFDYLGADLVDAASARYRFKFLREGQVLWVDVDARTGQILGQSGR